jgi:asparagine synthase (glutamine-hydrolysing)
LANERFTNVLLAHEHRVLLSGIGGDEVLGGVPTPLPELCNLLAQGYWFALVRQAVVWSLKKREPLLQLLGETLAQFLPPSLRRTGRQESQPSWLEPSFAQCYRSALAGYDQRYNVFGARPSFQDALLTIEGLRRQLSASALPQCPSYELRYALLDRDLLEFLFAIPRDQLVRPGERRSLMRRSLAHVLPAVILERKRKAFVVRRPLQSIPRLWAELESRGGEWVSASLGLINHAALEKTVRAVLTDDRIPLMQLLRTMSLERWLRHANDWKLLRLPSGSSHSSCGGHLTVRPSEVHQ